VKISGITHFALAVNSLDESEPFYRDVLGWEARGRLSSGHMSCFNVAGLNVLLCQQDKPVDVPDVHYAFDLEPDEWERAVKQVCSGGVKVGKLTYRETGYFPGRELHVYDPTGNDIELRDASWKPGMPTPSVEEIAGAPVG
jgi:predicted enzyme related to lactoylglutathione lyase